MDRIMLKNEAKALVRGREWIILKPYVLKFLVSLVLSFAFSFILSIFNLNNIILYSEGDIQQSLNIADFLTNLALIPMTYATCMYTLNIYKRPYEFHDVNQVFNGYAYFIKFIVIFLFTQFIISIGLLFLVVPGIILYCGFRPIQYVYMRHPELSVVDMMSHSWKMMKNHKMELFELEISFIGWSLLIAFTCGIAAYWGLPYMEMTYVMFFDRIYEEYMQIPYTEVYE